MAKSELKVSEAYRDMFYDIEPRLRSENFVIPPRQHYINLDAILRNKLDTYVNDDYWFNELPKKMKYEFEGDCYLLTNRDSYSAASSFASTFQCYQLGTIIGEETGGTKIFRANAMFKKLTRSAIQIGMSTTKLYTACYNNEMEGVQPTIEYIPNIFELGTKMDTHLHFTLRLIRDVQKKKAEMAR